MEASYLTVDSSESFPKKWRREEIQVLPQWTVTLIVICGELVSLILSHFMKNQEICFLQQQQSQILYCTEMVVMRVLGCSGRLKCVCICEYGPLTC
jgi:hypothetical protein